MTQTSLRILCIILAVGYASCTIAQSIQSSNILRQNKGNIEDISLSPATKLGDLGIDTIKSESGIFNKPIENIEVKTVTAQEIEDVASNLLTEAKKNNIESVELVATVREISTLNEEIKTVKHEYDRTISEQEKEALKTRINSLIGQLQKSTRRLNSKNQEIIAKNKQLKQYVKLNNDLEDQNRKIAEQFEEAKKLRNLEYFELIKKYLNGQIEILSLKFTKLVSDTAIVFAKIDTQTSKFKKLEWLGKHILEKDDNEIIQTHRDSLIIRLATVQAQKSEITLKFENFAKALEKLKDSVKILSSGIVSRVALSSPEEIRAYSTDSIKKIHDLTVTQYNETSKNIQQLVQMLDNYAEKFNTAYQVVSPRLNKYESLRKNQENEDHFSIFGGFKKILEERGGYVPAINVLANKHFGQQNFGGYGQVRLFTGFNTDGKNSNSSYNLFITEASEFGFSVDLGLGFNLIQTDNKETLNKKNRLNDLGLNTSFNFLGKKFTPSDSLTVSTNVIQWKTGIEILPFQNFVSLRFNINALFIGNNHEQLQKYYGSKRDTKWFSDIALSTLMNLNEDKNYKLRFELDIIPMNNDVKQFLGTNDKILPQIKMEIVKSF